MTIKDFISALSGGYFDEKLYELYGDSDNEMLRNRIRYIDACEKFSRANPECSDIRVFSVPMVYKVSGMDFFLSDDEIKIIGADEDFNYKTGVPCSLPGYSLCVSSVGFDSKMPEVDKEYLAVVRENEKKRQIAEYEALKFGDTAEFFRLLNESFMYTLCNPMAMTAVVLSREFLGGDGAVIAENNDVKAFVPSYLAVEYVVKINDFFGEVCDDRKIRCGGFEFTI